MTLARARSRSRLAAAATAVCCACTAQGLRVDPKPEGDPFARLAPPTLDAGAPEQALRLGPAAPPRVGEVALPFPPPARDAASPPAQVASPPLLVVRTQPAKEAASAESDEAHDAAASETTPTREPDPWNDVPGRAEEAPAAAFVVVSFNQPMVPLESLGELAREVAPLRLSPQPKGRFRWIDPRTLAFEAEHHLPAGTAFEAEVPQGTRSASGQALAAGPRGSSRSRCARSGSRRFR